MRALLFAALATLALTATAQAKQVQQYFYSGESFEAGGSSPAVIAFDGADQSVLVVGNGDKGAGLKISKFHPEGAPAPFTTLGGEPASFNTGAKINGEASAAIAVDESATASNGNFYIASTEPAEGGTVFGYASGGSLLPGFPVSVPGACGVAVAPDGHLWVASALLGGYAEFTAAGALTGHFLSFGARHGGCRIAIDLAGNFYLTKGERLAKYDSSRHFAGDLGPSDLEGYSPLLAFDRGDDTLFELFDYGTSPLTQADSSGDPLMSFGGADPVHFYPGLSNPRDLAVDPQTHRVYVLTAAAVDVFARDPSSITTPTATTGGVEELSSASATLTGTLDPDGTSTTDCHFEWGADDQFGSFIGYGKTAPCSQGNVFAGGSGENAVTASMGGLSKGTTYHFRLAAKNANGVLGFGRDEEFTAADPPVLGEAAASHITSDTARIGFELDTEGADSTYRVEIGTDTSYGTSFPVHDATVSATKPGPNFEGIEVILTPQPESQEVHGLKPATEYHYRVVAENPAGMAKGEDRSFKTFALPTSGEDSCANAHARQQTSAAGLLDCRAYELVSAPDTGGYDVRSDLSSGVSALATSPQASDAALYSMRSGTIPGIAGHPTNRGADPYLATRGEGGWSTRYVGLPSNNPFATGPFASPLSGFDSALDTFSFGGEEICKPCFQDGSTDAPLRLPDGSLVQGMAGSMQPGPAEPAGTVKKPLSADGSHFLFGTTAQLEPTANSNGTDATIYSRDLSAKTTEVISTDESGTAIANGEEVAELDVSADGSRTVIGEKLATDSAGNAYYHLYLHIAGTPESVDLMPGATQGALYDGMTEDGARVFFTSYEPLGAGETDESADIYEDEVPDPGAVSPQRISTGIEGAGDTDACSPPGNPDNWNAVSGAGKCNAVAYAGGAGVASEAGDFYFLSPELLDGSSNGIQDQPNLYVVRPGSTPHFVATIDSSLAKPPPPPPKRPTLTQSFGGSHIGPETMTVDQSNGDLYVFEPPVGRVSRYTSSGAADNFTEGPGAGTNKLTGLEPFEIGSEVAVDNSGGSFERDTFLTGFSNISIFSPAGKPLGELNGSGSNKGFFEEVCGVAVDRSNGDVYVVEYGGNIWRYEPIAATLPLSDSDYTVSGIKVAGTETCNVAADAGDVYVSQPFGGPVYHFNATSFATGSPPSVSGTEITAESFALSIDPQTHELYVDEGNKIVSFNPAGEKQLTLGAGELSASRGVAVNASSHHVYASRPFGANGLKLTEFGYELPPGEPINDPAIVHAVRQAGTHDSSDFEVTPDGAYAAYTSPLSPPGFDSGERYEVFRYDAVGDSTACLSCSPTLARPASDATLSPYGLSLLDDGRVFFTTGESLTLRDSNEKRDAYEWENGKLELISTGTSPTDSELLSASSDGKNAFFFTRQKLVPEDENGSSVRLYTAREDGGFAFGPPQFQCAASDECHGASTPAAPPLGATTTAGTPGNFEEEGKRCAKGKVRRKGKCVKRHVHKRHNHKRAEAKRGGGK